MYNRPVNRRMMGMSQPSDYQAICNYLASDECKDIRKHICRNCAVSSLYDKNNKSYQVGRNTTMAQVKGLIALIREINGSNTAQKEQTDDTVK